ncbi:hypothetical protein LRS10_19960 [Phenylobacterium sp. J426]|uniref:MHYT domain-containing protein n=1 Tax=Phenylobacterium sp. J426 TaxID=2898439 RepID=UPI0021517457|nr:MHYT domain-containing protein [Phenylobacterium sp. J426]MCR5876217.1 hypothetical protein [Phenylobacterium sp. J426]
MAGALMGLGICLMHYVGMAALRTAVSLGYRPGYVAASLVIAVTAATAALFAVRRERSLPWRTAASVILGLAIVGMHYTAMAGLTLTVLPDSGQPLPGAPARRPRRRRRRRHHPDPRPGPPRLAL